LKKRKHHLRALIGLRQHCSCGLLNYLRPCELGCRLAVISVQDPTARLTRVIRDVGHIVYSIGQTVDRCPVERSFSIDGLDCKIKGGDRGV